MTALICVIAVVALISLYDHFSSRSWQKVTSDGRNDTVFEKRNKAYGAYLIRRDYDKRLMLILGGLVAGIGVLYAATRGGEIEKQITTSQDTITIDIAFPEKDDDIKPEIVENRPAGGAPAQTSPEMVIRDNADPSDLPIDIGLPPGPPTPPGPIDEWGIPEPPGPGVGGGTEPVEPPKEPETYVDEEAKFPGDLRKFIVENLKYPQVPYELGIQGKCFLKFVVSTKGDISDVTVMRGVPDCPECDKEAKRVIKTMPDWTPAKKNGKVVASYYNIPIAFKIQD